MAITLPQAEDVQPSFIGHDLYTSVSGHVRYSPQRGSC